MSAQYLRKPGSAIYIGNFIQGCPQLSEWPCTIEIAWVDRGRPFPGSYKQEILANRGQKVRSRSTGTIQSCTASRDEISYEIYTSYGFSYEILIALLGFRKYLCQTKSGLYP